MDTNVINARPPNNLIESWIPKKKKDITPDMVPVRGRMVKPIVRQGIEMLVGEINLVNVELQQKSFQEQAAAYLGEQGAAEGAADAAKAGGASKGVGGILGTIAGIAKLFL